MEHKYTTAVFDLDGTLLDTSEGILKSVKETLGYFEIKCPDENILKTFIGPPIQFSFEKHCGIHNVDLAEVTAYFRNLYKSRYLFQAVPYEGIFDLFSELNMAKIQVAVATYKRKDYAEDILKHFGFDKYTDLLFGTDFENKLKKSDMIKLAVQNSHIPDFDRVVMIGDSDNDAIGAADANVDFIGVTYGFGFHSEKDMSEYRYVNSADSVSDLKSILL